MKPESIEWYGVFPHPRTQTASVEHVRMVVEECRDRSDERVLFYFWSVDGGGHDGSDTYPPNIDYGVELGEGDAKRAVTMAAVEMCAQTWKRTEDRQ